MAKASVPAVKQPDQLPDYLREYQGPLGTETIDSNDVNIPRLKLAQSMTPEVKDKLVEEGDMFHNITKEILIPRGEKGIIVPICYSKQYILWRDRSDGGGIFARANRIVTPKGDIRYQWDRPNETFTHKLGGKTKVTWKTGSCVENDGLAEFGSEIPGDKESGPAATAHYNYVVWLPQQAQMLALSFNKSSAKKAKDLNAMLKMGNAPVFARQFALAAITDQNGAGDKFFNYALAPSGFLQDKALFDVLRRLHGELKDRGLNVDFSDEEKRGETIDADDAERF